MRLKMLRLDNAYRTPDYTSCDPNEAFVCPYDSNHIIRAKRFPYHLKNCRKNFPLSNMAHCPFNARHVVPGPEYKYHLANCPDKQVIEQDIAYGHEMQNGEETILKGCTDVPPYNMCPLPTSSEDWDKEMLCQPKYDYNPPTDVGHQLYRSTCGMTPAEKRAHREYLKKQDERRKAGLPPELEYRPTDEGSNLDGPKVSSPLRLPHEPAMAYQQVNQNESASGENARLGLIGLGRGLLMNKQMMMVNELNNQDKQHDNVMKTQRAVAPTAQGFGHGRAELNPTNEHAIALSAQTYVRMVGRGRGGTPQNRNRHPIGGLAGQRSSAIYIAQ
ncbi:uncharacterized protein LOC117106887 isoform X2 [Anneissia japonica]|uniref:uncharacterized protein LOC117106887 isoform X2 n=1 Tax=Anneissia japonica TaxID=1529436 RepID=UPI001425ADBF|nr:uncharacterized protein LOC117106887 isoform X2 [Anneissia japonica]